MDLAVASEHVALPNQQVHRLLVRALSQEPVARVRGSVGCARASLA